METKIYFVYALTNPLEKGPFTYNIKGKTYTFKYKPFYVGSGNRKRPRVHTKQTNRAIRLNIAFKQPHHEFISKIIAQKKEPKIKILGRYNKRILALQLENIVLESLQIVEHGGILQNTKSSKGFTKATKIKMGLSKKGRTLSAEHKAKIAKALKNKPKKPGRKHKPMTEEHKAKIGLSNKGKPRSAEYRAKISKTLKKRYYRPK
jgi:hypothetical protein